MTAYYALFNGYDTLSYQNGQGVAEDGEVRGGRSVSGARNLRKQVSALVARPRAAAAAARGLEAPS